MPQGADYLVLTDSACDMPFDLAKECGVDIMSFDISVDGKSYTERVDFNFEEYYDILRGCEGIPSTAHITTTRFQQKFEACDDAGVRQLLYISINGSGSATLNAAVMAKEAFMAARPGSKMEIFLVDSHTYSMAYGWFVYQACHQLTQGMPMPQVVAWLEDALSRVDIILGAFSLKFMKKSGRISAAAAFAGELLGLRPVISLTDGVSTVRKKVRSDKDVLPALMDYALENGETDTDYWIGGTDDAVIADLAEQCTRRYGRPPLTTFKLGAAVATNTGPDAIAIVFMGQPRPRG